VIRPSGWRTKRLKFVARLAYGKALKAEVRTEGEVPVFGSNGCVGTNATPNTVGATIIVGRKGSFGKVTYSPVSSYCIDTAFFVDHRQTHSNLRWLFYALQSIGLDDISQDTGVPGLPREHAHERPLDVPPNDDQVHIAAFLDRKTAAIDQLIEKKERLIELLQEQQQALLDDLLERPKVPLVKLGFYVHLLPGFAFASDGFNHDEGVRLLRGINVSVGTLRWNDTVHWPANDVERFADFRLQPGDVVLGMDRPWISEGMRVAVVRDLDCPSLLLQRVARLRARSILQQEYLLLLLSSMQFKRHFEPILTGVSVPHISPGQVLGFRFRIPQADEQRRTCQVLRTHMDKLNELRAKLEDQIALLREYRQACITAAVTGEISIDAGEPQRG
jgi:type I restriction enzyme, S subunit